jgi:HAMP domain-containing protein
MEREIFEKARFFLFTMESIRKHYGKVTRPAVTKVVGDDKFIVEAMSTSFNARGIAELVKESFPNYTFKHISTNPRHLPNKADKFEEGVISKFQADKELKEWKGFVEKDNHEYFVVAKPVRSDITCLKCHSSLENAPHEVVARYGTTAGFGIKENEVMASLLVYVPTKLAKDNAMKALLVFASFYAFIFFVVLIVIDRVIANSIISPIEEFAEVAEEVSRGKFEREFSVKTNDEIKIVADAFTRMKLSLAKALDIMRKK